jgi:preprotein translocase subunit YajC
LTGLYNFLFLLQVGQGEAGQAAPVATEGAQQAGEEAAGQFGACGAGGGMDYTFLIWMVFLFGLMYFLLIRPQKKQQQQHDQLLSSLKKGDRVMTTGGIYGTIRGLSENVATVEVADNVLLRVHKKNVAGLQADPKTNEAKKS